MIAAVGAHHQVHIQVVAARLPQHGQHSVHLKAHAVPSAEPALGIIVIKTTVTNPSLSGAGYSGYGAGYAQVQNNSPHRLFQNRGGDINHGYNARARGAGWSAACAWAATDRVERSAAADVGLDRPALLSWARQRTLAYNCTILQMLHFNQFCLSNSTLT